MTGEETPAEKRRQALIEQGSAEPDDDRVPDVPVDVVAEVERLTRLARDAADRAEETAGAGETAVTGETAEGPDEASVYRSRRDDLLASHGYACRIRDGDDTLVLYPEEWVEDGTVRLDRIDDTDRGIEVTLSGPGDDDEWAAVEAHNAALVDEVEERFGPEHAANARSFADFMGNHYVKEIERATAEEVEEFLAEYYPRNAWPSAREEALVEKSVESLFDVAGAPVPAFRSKR